MWQEHRTWRTPFTSLTNCSAPSTHTKLTWQGCKAKLLYLLFIYTFFFLLVKKLHKADCKWPRQHRHWNEWRIAGIAAFLAVSFPIDVLASVTKELIGKTLKKFVKASVNAHYFWVWCSYPGDQPLKQKSVCAGWLISRQGSARVSQTQFVPGLSSRARTRCSWSSQGLTVHPSSSNSAKGSRCFRKKQGTGAGQTQ